VELSQIVPALETAWHAFQTSFSLSKEVASLVDSLETRKLLDQAKGILMEQQKMSEDQAHRTLQKMSQDQAIFAQRSMPFPHPSQDVVWGDRRSERWLRPRRCR